MQSHPRQKIFPSNGTFVQRLMLMPDKCNIQRERHNFMTGLTFKNCDTFYRRVYINLRFTSEFALRFASSSIGIGLSGFLTVGCLQTQANSLSNHVLTASTIISDTRSIIDKSNLNKKIQNTEKVQYLPITARAKIAGSTINLEVTRTTAEQAQGLMFRPTLPEDRGMLFNFNPPQAISFWMKNVPVALDMVFIYQGKVVAIAANVPPCKANPCAVYPETPVVIDRVIELRAGRTQELRLKLGDRITVENL
jgi:uncharacterized protein